MTRKATKTPTNRYYKARLEASKYNEKLLTRAGAVELLPGVSEDSLKKYELGINRPPNVVVALMADTYVQPELRYWYCANECPLGNDCMEIPDMPPERALIRLENILDDAQEAIQSLAGIMDDGQLDDVELSEIPEIRRIVASVKHRCNEVLAVLDKAKKRRKF